MARQNRRLSNQLATRKSVVTAPRSVIKVGRNEPCPCGSGDKYKDCCVTKGEAHLQKLERERFKAQLKEQGVPWYRRWLL